MGRVIKDESGKRVTVGSVHEARMKHDWRCLDAGKNSGILGFMGSGKSVGAVCDILWDIIQNRNVQIQLVCNADREAQKRVHAIRRYIGEDVDFREIAGPDTPHGIEPARTSGSRSQDSWTQHRFTVCRDSRSIEPTLIAYGINSGSMGSRTHIQTYDDPIDERNSSTSYQRKKISDNFKIKWQSRTIPYKWRNKILPGGFQRMRGTPYWVDDLYAELRENSDWWWLEQPVSQELDCVISRTWHGKLLTKEERLPLPIPWTKEGLEIKSRGMTHKFNQGFLLVPFSEADKTYPNFNRALDDTITPQELMRRDEFNWAFFMGYDPSSSKRMGNVIIVLGIDLNSGRIGMFHVDRGAWKGGTRPDDDTVIKHFIAAYNAYNPYVAYVENDAIQTYIEESIRSIGSPGQFTVMPCQTGGGKKHHSDLSIKVMDVEFANDRFIIPTKHVKDHDMTCNCHWCNMIMEFRIHPHGPHDDSQMATWFAWRAIKDYGEPMKEQGNLDPRIFEMPAPDPALDAIDGHGMVPGLYDVPDMDMDDGFDPDML